MASMRRSRRSNGRRLTVINGGLAQSEAEPAGWVEPGAEARGGHPLGAGDGVSDLDELEELRDALTTLGAPASALLALERGGDPGEIIGSLIEAGVLPSPEESLDDLLGTWKPLLRRGCGPFEAELAGIDFMSVLRHAASDPDTVPVILAELLQNAARTGSDEALAMLRVMAVTGPRDLRTGATEAADALVAAGLKDRTWVRELGVPRLDRCFGYADDLGAQEAIAVSFRYGRKAHAIAVLIDHDLGGGVKDCWPTDRPDEVYEGYRGAAAEYGLQMRDYSPAEAYGILVRALAQPPCPAEPDQIEDVEAYLSLLEQRVTLLEQEVTLIEQQVGGPEQPAGGRERRVAGRERRVGAPAPVVSDAARSGPTIHRLKITLGGSKPPIWRRLETPSTMTLQRLHGTIQDAFGWQDDHLWVFETPVGDFGLPDADLGHRSAAAKKLSGVAPGKGDAIRYTYDFGDKWCLEIRVEEVLAAQPGVAYPRCVTGRRAAPPDDCGGLWGYAELVEILADPGHPEHEERLEWLGLESAADFDPAAFDLAQINERLSATARVLVAG